MLFKTVFIGCTNRRCWNLGLWDSRIWGCGGNHILILQGWGINETYVLHSALISFDGDMLTFSHVPMYRSIYILPSSAIAPLHSRLWTHQEFPASWIATLIPARLVPIGSSCVPRLRSFRPVRIRRTPGSVNNRMINRTWTEQKTNDHEQHQPPLRPGLRLHPSLRSQDTKKSL